MLYKHYTQFISYCFSVSTPIKCGHLRLYLHNLEKVSISELNFYAQLLLMILSIAYKYDING